MNGFLIPQHWLLKFLEKEEILEYQNKGNFLTVSVYIPGNFTNTRSLITSSPSIRGGRSPLGKTVGNVSGK